MFFERGVLISSSNRGWTAASAARATFLQPYVRGRSAHDHTQKRRPHIVHRHTKMEPDV